eukprot:scaffold594_cov71-Skeletonema_dohrnii-CCMP3373.AAC.7
MSTLSVVSGDFQEEFWIFIGIPSQLQDDQIRVFYAPTLCPPSLSEEETSLKQTPPEVTVSSNNTQATDGSTYVMNLVAADVLDDYKIIGFDPFLGWNVLLEVAVIITSIVVAISANGHLDSKSRTSS